MRVTVLYIDGCPHWRTVHDLLLGLADGVSLEVSSREIGGMRGSAGGDRAASLAVRP